jgi:hypothetical protein
MWIKARQGKARLVDERVEMMAVQIQHHFSLIVKETVHYGRTVGVGHS